MARWLAMAWSAPVPAPRSFSQILFLVSIIVLALSTAVVAEDDTSLLPSSASKSFPQCGLSCSLLQQAQKGCVPPQAQTSTRSTYVSCFCQSATITQLHNSADGTCDDTCTSASDRALIKTWYSDFCSSGGKTTDDSSKDATTTSGSAQGDSATSTSTSTAKAQNVHPAPPSWISTHYKWIIMVVVLIVGFGILTALGVWLKRRHDAKYPNLYHAAAKSGSTDSGLLFNRQQNASPGPGQPGAFSANVGPAQGQQPYGYANTDSASSRTEVAPPRAQPTRTPSRLQKSSQPPGHDSDIEIRETPR